MARSQNEPIPNMLLQKPKAIFVTGNSRMLPDFLFFNH